MTISFLSILIAQGSFARSYGSPYDEWGYSVIATSDGGYAVVGCRNTGANYDPIVLKLNATGGLDWSRQFGAPENDYAYSIAQTSDGGYVVVGWKSTPWPVMLVIKLSALGGVQWVKTIDQNNLEKAFAVSSTSDGGFVLVGHEVTGPALNFVAIKFSSSGSIQFIEAFSENARGDTAYSVIQTRDGGYAIAGYTQSFGAGTMGNCHVVKIDAAGTYEWETMLGGASFDIARSVLQSDDGSYVVAGHTSSFGVGGYDILVFKLATDGTPVWVRTFGGGADDYAFSVTQAHDGGYVVAGYTYSFGSGNADACVMKLDENGGVLWARTFGGGADDYAFSVTQAHDGGYLVAGTTNSFGAGGNDIFILKLNEDGGYPGCVNDCPILAGTPTPAVQYPHAHAWLSLNSHDATMTTTAPNFDIGNICPPLDIRERVCRSPNAPVASYCRGGLVFLSAEETSISVYSPDGRIAYSGQLQKGENRISLGRGVYLWVAGGYRGKAAVR